MNVHPVIDVTDRIRERSAGHAQRLPAPAGPAAARDRGPTAWAAPTWRMPLRHAGQRQASRGGAARAQHRHRQCLQRHAVGPRAAAALPRLIKDEARRHGATAQVAGGVPAMCDGVTQGTPGMELSLFSRDVIAMATAVSLSHDMFDGALMLGVCDKIVPGLLIGALHFGHLPTVFVPAGPMTSGLSNSAKAKVREQAAQGLVGRAELLEAEQAAYHAPGHLHLLRHGQQQPDAAGGHGPARAGHGLCQPGRRTARGAYARGGAHRAGHHQAGPAHRPLVDERAIVNAMVALLATGGSTNHLIHWVAVARSGGHPDRLGRLCRAVGGRAAAGARVPQRHGRREPVPGGRRHRLRAARAAGRRAAACRRADGAQAACATTPRAQPWMAARWCGATAGRRKDDEPSCAPRPRRSAPPAA
jgi:phosphogluconate dehydratase